MIEFVVPHGTTRDRWVWRIEVGFRAALDTRSFPGDARWWSRLDFEGRGRRWE